MQRHQSRTQLSSPNLNPPQLDVGSPSACYQGQSGSGGDTLQLFSIPWMDIMDMGFEDSGGQEIQSASALGEPTSSNMKSPECSFNTNSMLSTYSFPSPIDGYDLEQASQIVDMHKRTLQHDTTPSEPAIVDHSNTTGKPLIGNFGSLDSSTSFMQLDFTADLGAFGATQWPTPVSEKSVSAAPIHRKEACIQKLSELSADLMKDLNRLITCKLACSFLFTPSEKNTAEYLFRTLDGSFSHDNAVGRLLQGTERFLELVQEYKQPSHVTTPTQSPLDPSDFSQSPTSTNAQERMESRWSLIESYLSREKPPRAMASESTIFDESSSSQSSVMDIPSMLTILNCYTCLLKIFETVFFAIQYSLNVSPISPLYAKLPPTVPGFEISGFQLKNYRSLQIKILIQVSRHMLDSMEKSLGFGCEKGEISGIFGNPVFKALLQTLLKQDSVAMSGGDSTGIEKVRKLLTTVESVLK